MGRRRKQSKTTWSPLKEEKYEGYGMSNKSGPARNLPKNDLGAVIFGCKHHTYSECLNKKIFGLPHRHYSYVKNVRPGLKLFLFNYSDRALHGIFEAVSPGQLNIDPHAWVTSEGTEMTPYAAQVRIDVQRLCRPLHEEQFKPVIAENYYVDNLFYFELDKRQSEQLVKLFLSSPLPDKKIPRPPNKVKSNMFDALSEHDADEAADNEFENHDQPECSQSVEMRLTETEHSSALVSSNASPHERKWSALFNDFSSSGRVNHGGGLDCTKESFSMPMSGNSGAEWEFATSHETGRLLPQDCPDMVYTESNSTTVESWEDHVPFDNKDNCLHGHIQGSSLPENTICLGGEVGELKSYGNVKVPIENNSHDHRKEDMYSSENIFATSSQVLLDTQSTNYEAMFIELKQEVEKLKESQLQHNTKIEILEQELANSKLEILKLKSQHCDLGKVPSYVIDRLEFDECKLPRSELDDCKLRRLKLDDSKFPRLELVDCKLPRLGLDDSKLPRFPKGETVLIAGGFDGCSWFQDLISYSPTLDHVLQLCPMRLARSFAATALVNGELYILGGIHDNVCHNTVESYNPMSNQWMHKPPLNKAKGNLAGASLYEKIFVIGGRNGGECYSEVEVLDLNIGRWVYTRPMHKKRFAPAATELNGAIYVSGGYDGDYLSCVERFDPRECAWTSVGSMHSRRGCHSVVPFKEKLYALGGYNGDRMTSTVEAFDPRIGLWTMEEPMQAAKGYFGSFVIGGKIYAIGGRNDSAILDIVECYEEGCGWQVVMDLKGIGKRCYFSSLVV